MSPKPRGVLLGRLSPLHIGHEAIVAEIKSLGLRPLILVGGSGNSDDRHPYTDSQKHSMLRRAFGYTVDIEHIKDEDNWDTWLTNIEKLLLPSDTLFINNKEQDRLSFTVRDKVYTDAFYTDIWEDQGYKTHTVTFPEKIGISHINATDIRANLEATTHLLSAPVLEYLRSLGA